MVVVTKSCKDPQPVAALALHKINDKGNENLCKSRTEQNKSAVFIFYVLTPPNLYKKL